jgi:hypothetical protein
MHLICVFICGLLNILVPCWTMLFPNALNDVVYELLVGMFNVHTAMFGVYRIVFLLASCWDGQSP